MFLHSVRLSPADEAKLVPTNDDYVRPIDTDSKSLIDLSNSTTTENAGRMLARVSARLENDRRHGFDANHLLSSR
jgi:hypothetical protein